VDEFENERRRTDCIKLMSDLENQFVRLKEHLFRDKSSQVSKKLEEVKNGTAKEYIEPLSRLEGNLKIKLQIAEVKFELQKKNLLNKCDGEKQAANQNYECEKKNLYSNLQQELENKIHQLKQDHHNTDINQCKA
ncbi:hypothetical protein HELRODRAFT_143676, partial [Helobdella robusta]|uniref:Uncharacterized protein n=1 Tax=Helobdella robusta TaxID=6412 RepID=T1EJB6_HELRO